MDKEEVIRDIRKVIKIGVKHLRKAADEMEKLNDKPGATKVRKAADDGEAASPPVRDNKQR